jgi:hypothetical protein
MSRLPALLAALALGTSASADSSGLRPAKVRLELYGVSAWVDPSVDFARIAIAKPVPAGKLTDEAFADEVMRTVAPGEWGRRMDWSVQCQHGLLIVRAPDWVHRQLVTSYFGGLKIHPDWTR